MKRELDIAVGLAEKAGRVILERYRTEFRVSEKSGGRGPVTDADMAADEIICEGLSRAFPADALTSEEREDDPRRIDSERCWLVDPLDGTKHFVDRDGEFAVMMGLVVDGAPSLGVIHLPVEGLTIAGASSIGVSVRSNGIVQTSAISLASWSEAGDSALRIASSRDSAGSRTRRAVANCGPHELVHSGSIGRKVALILLGRADAYLTLAGRSHRWDACAPEALMREAGGRFSDAFGEPLDYRAEDLRNHRGLLACRPGLESRLVEGAVRLTSDR